MPVAKDAYPDALSFPGPGIMYVFWALGLWGLGRVAKGDNIPVLLIVLVSSGFVIGSFAITHAAGARLRLPVEAMFLPLVGVGIASILGILWNISRRGTFRAGEGKGPLA